uniref:Peptide-N-glycosidase F C-terminal domain-containing protein n=1 Tax=Ciona savignyi TaxID=51511 RepID=H2YWF0_CIOSA
MDHGCGLNQVVFHSNMWKPPVKILKRVDARYDWAFVHQWKPNSPSLTHVINACTTKMDVTFNNAGTPLGCANRVPDGVVPNEHGTWLYGRDGWCDGLQVDPWLIDVSSELIPNSINNITYRGLFNGKDPNPKQNPGLIRVASYLIYYN